MNVSPCPFSAIAHFLPVMVSGLLLMCALQSHAAEDRFAPATVRAEIVEDGGNGKRRIHRLMTDERQLYVNLLVTEMWSGSPRVQGSSMTSQQAVVADHVIVKLKPGVALNALVDATATMGYKVSALPPSPVFRVTFPAPDFDAIIRARNAIRSLPIIVYAEDDGILHAFATPNDPQYTLNQWGANRIGCTNAWNYRTDATAIPIAVLDSGVSYSHPDLSGSVDTALAWSSDKTNNADDVVSPYHGTAVAGVLGARGNNNLLIAGVCWQARIIPIKVIPGTNSTLAAGIDHARINGAKVLNISLGSSEYSQALHDAVISAKNAGMILVCAAGNNGRNIDASPPYPVYPAYFGDDNIISVAASNSSEAIVSNTNYGSTSVDLAAPGDAIYTLSPPATYQHVVGTSFAAPYVAGSCALLWAKSPSLSYQQVRSCILSTVTPFSTLTNKVATGGRLNLEAAMIAAMSIANPPVSVSMTAGNNWCSEYQNRTGAFTISRPSTNTTGSLTVFYSFTGGTAVKGTHYSATPDGSVTLNVGEVSRTVSITPITTAGYEVPSTIQLNITPNSAYTIATGSATMTRYDQDLQLTGAIPSATYPGGVIPFNYRQVRLVNAASIPSGVVTINARDSIVVASGTSATTTVASGATLNLTAPNLISLLPGTTIALGSTFSAKIQ